METRGEHLNRRQFARAVHDLERITRQIAARYIRPGVPLTWRLLHAIEAEAVADLGFAGRHEAALRELFARPADFQFPETDDVVEPRVVGRRARSLSFVFATLTSKRLGTASRNSPLRIESRGLSRREVCRHVGVGAHFERSISARSAEEFVISLDLIGVPAAAITNQGLGSRSIVPK